MSRIATALLVLALMGCGSGGTYTSPATGGGTPPPPPPPPPPAGTLIALNLSNGTTNELASMPVLSAGQIVFRRIGGTAPLSSGDAVSEAGISDATATVTISTCYISTHEVTQAQWSSLATFAPAYAAPWTTYASDATLGGSSAVAPNKPVFGVSWTALQAVLAAWNTGSTRTDLRAPTPAEWEFACRAGATSAVRYHWGSSEDPFIAGQFALVRQTRTVVGPGICGARTGNAFALFDMSGNVWEWTFDGSIASLRGGSWFDNLRSSASGNRQDMAPDIPYPTAGVRLILELP